jgi:hypothetical protein
MSAVLQEGHVPRHSARWHRVMRRFRWRCAYCRCELDAWNGSVDHVVARSRGGRGERNLVAACLACNRLKADRDVLEFAPGFQLPVDHRQVFKDQGSAVRKAARGPLPIAARRRPSEPSPIATLAMLDQLAARASQAVERHGAAVAASLNVCGHRRYAYRSEAEQRRRGDRVVAHCPACSGFHLVRPR